MRFQIGTSNAKRQIILKCKFGISKAKHMTNAPFLKERGAESRVTGGNFPPVYVQGEKKCTLNDFCLMFQIGTSKTENMTNAPTRVYSNPVLSIYNKVCSG